MDAYPEEYVEHNLPLVLVSGLGEQHPEPPRSPGIPRQENGTRIQASSSEIGGEKAQSLLSHLLQMDGSSQPWNASALPGSSGKLKYRIKAIGRTYTLPPRKAAPLAQATSLEGSQKESNGPQKTTELHSPLSPLSPGSPIYPDGVFTPLWLSKHQQLVPALLISFFNISAGNSSQDEQLKADINSIRTSINRSGFKTKLVAVLISDKSILQAPDMDDRLTSIRRSTSLDSKTGLFFIPPMSPIEISTFVQGMLNTLQPLCIDYYRDLTKHARRKKPRASSTVLPSSPIGVVSQPLPVSGWNVRYEVKQGIFAEFRQEMETAERHYSSAIDELFAADGMLEFYSTSSQRWLEVRSLCDCLALRILRCQLWTSSTSAAAQSWVSYKFRVAELITRRGKGLQTSDWHAWEARWAEIIAQLIIRAKTPTLIQTEKNQSESAELAGQQIYAPPEKAAAAAERIAPFQHLHHAGYWYKTAVRGSRAKQRRRALEISEGDGSSSPSEASAQDDPAELRRLTAAAGEEFESRNQVRMTELVKLDLAHDFADAERYGDALNILIPLWDETTWRDDGWEDLLAVLLLVLRRCAEQQGKSEVVVSATYELLGSRSELAKELTLDLGSCLDSMKEATSDAVTLNIKDQQRLCPVSVSFAFETKETHVGERLGCQLLLESSTNSNSIPLVLSNVTLSFGTSKSIKIVHDSNSEAPAPEFIDLSQQTSKNGGWSDAMASLALRSGERRVFRFVLTFRDAEIILLTQATLSIETGKLKIEHSFTDADLLSSNEIGVEMDGQLERKLLRSANSTAVNVLPKPPKVQIVVHGLRKEYYTGEVVALDITINNGEVEPVSGKLNAQINGENEARLSMHWIENEESSEPPSDTSKPTPDAPIIKALPLLDSGGSHKLTLSLTAPTEPFKTAIDVSVEYTLSKDYTTPLRKSVAVDLSFVAPFEAKFNFGPLLYPEPWPSYFDRNGGTTKEQPGGIPQLWRLNSQLRCLAIGRIMLRKAEIVVGGVSGDSMAQATLERPKEKQNLKQGQIARYSFELRTQKHSLDDRRPTVVESMLEITWSRENDDSLVTTRIPIPRLTLPVSEPRVLCTLADNAPEDCDAIVQYHIENPSNHFLTFAITMDASEDFSFSGPKSRALSLAPLSRYKVEYRIIVPDEAVGGHEDGRWIWPALQVVDSYYQKTLRVHSGGPDIKVDEKQNIGVWIGTS